MSEVHIPPKGYFPSSWNYGSFYPSCPIYNQKPPRPNTSNVPQRSMSVNKYGKVQLKPEERIVNEDMIRTLKEFKNIKFGDPQKREKSNNNIKNSTIVVNNEFNSQNSQFSKEMRESKIDESKKNSFKYQLTYDEWMAIKVKQNEILSKWKDVNDQDEKNIKQINVRIEEEYEKIKADNINKWIEKKDQENAKKMLEKLMEEEEKIKKEEEKENEKKRRIDDWCQKQNMKLRKELQDKREKEMREKEELERKKEEKEAKRMKSDEEFQKWLKMKEETKKSQINKSTNSNQNKKKNYNENEMLKVHLGPYSTGKSLKFIEKKFNSEYKLQPSTYIENDKEKKSTHKKGEEDSLQDLSSIKKDTPRSVGNEGDDYE